MIFLPFRRIHHRHPQRDTREGSGGRHLFSDRRGTLVSPQAGPNGKKGRLSAWAGRLGEAVSPFGNELVMEEKKSFQDLGEVRKAWGRGIEEGEERQEGLVGEVIGSMYSAELQQTDEAARLPVRSRRPNERGEPMRGVKRFFYEENPHLRSGFRFQKENLSLAETTNLLVWFGKKWGWSWGEGGGRLCFFLDGAGFFLKIREEGAPGVESLNWGRPIRGGVSNNLLGITNLTFF